MIIELHGDSTQAGAGAGGATPHSTLAFLLEQRGHTGHTVLSRAQGGLSVQAALSTGHACYGGLTYPAYIATSPAQIIIANWGINDVYLPGNDSWQYAADQRTAGDHARANSKTYITETPNPILPTPHDANLAVYADRLVWLCNLSGYPYVSQHALITSDFPTWRTHMDASGLHPDGALALYKAHTVCQALITGGFV